MRFVRVGGLSVVALLAIASGVRAQDFYAGKTLTVIAGFPPGGGVDGSMRLLTRYLAKYTAGRPTILPRNSPGTLGTVPAATT